MALQSIHRDSAGTGTVIIRRITNTVDSEETGPVASTSQESGTRSLQDVVVQPLQ